MSEGKGQKLDIAVFAATARTDHEYKFLSQAIAPGFAISGDTVRICEGRYEPCDVAVIFWSPKNGHQPRMRAARSIRNLHPRNLLIIEMPLLRMTEAFCYRLGFDHVHRAGRFAPSDSSVARIHELGVELKPWRSGVGPIVVAGQLHGDYSLDGVDAFEWSADVAEYLARKKERPIILRPHPLDKDERWDNLAERTGAEVSRRPLIEDLARAGVWVSYTSGSAIDAVVAGVPSVSLSINNFAWPVSGHGLDGINRPFTPQREAWLARIAGSQWTEAEIRTGRGWQAVRSQYDLDASVLPLTSSGSAALFEQTCLVERTGAPAGAGPVPRSELKESAMQSVAPLMDAKSVTWRRGADPEEVLASFSQAYAGRVRSRMAEIYRFQNSGLLTPDMYIGKDVLDWEAGDSAFSIAFLLLGAANVLAIDSWTTPPPALGIEGFSFLQSPLADWAALESRSFSHFDLVFSNTVTEHIGNLPTTFDAIRGLLKSDGFYFNNHDNYYSPCGSHDHGFWFYGQAGRVDFQGVACWDAEEKCAFSEEHRARLTKQWPWTWSERNDNALRPDDCKQCRYYKRSKPWAHLHAVSEFSDVFNDPSFTMQRAKSGINKLTPFQLLQLLAEARLEVIKIVRTYASNEPDETLYEFGFSRLDLTTTNVRTLCRALRA